MDRRSHSPCGRGPKKTLALACFALLAVTALPGAASAARRVTFEANGGAAMVKPAVLYASPSDGPYATHLHWAGWGQPRATATGRVFFDTCKPNCSLGFHEDRGEVVLAGVHSCSGKARYSLLRIIYFDQPDYNLRATYNCRGSATHIHIG